MHTGIDIEIHEVATIFPEMVGNDLMDLADDVRENGLIESIWTYEGKLIDGRNRLKACQISGVEPTFREWKGTGSLVKFVVSLNRKRRQLTVGQMAASAVEIKRMLEKEIAEEKRKKQSEGGKSAGKGRPKVFANNCDDLTKPRDARKEAAKEIGVNPQYVTDAENIAKASPETFEQVKSGEKTIPEAKRELGLVKPKPTGQCRLNGELVPDPPDIAKQRAAGKIPANVVVDIETNEDPTTVADVKEDRDERDAMASDGLSDDDWLAKLPARAYLKGSQLKTFDGDALLYRHLESHRNTFRHHASRLTSKIKREGEYYWKLNSFLKADEPSKWLVCPPTTDGGCGGSGVIPVYGECPKCRSRGYRINK